MLKQDRSDKTRDTDGNPRPQSKNRHRFFNISRLPSPRAKYDLAKLVLPGKSRRTGKRQKGFETKDFARKEDKRRVKSLRQLIDGAGDFTDCGFARAEARTLARWLEKALRAGKFVSSYASLVFMRRFRLRFCGAVLELLEPSHCDGFALYTIVSKDWVIRGSELAAFEPKKLLARFRAQLNRLGLAGLDGWLVASVHGEYDQVRDEFRLHIHAVVAGDKVKAVEAIRRLPTYSADPEYVSRPIRRQREIDDLPRAVSYFVAQAFWVAEPLAEALNGAHHLNLRGNRIPEPRHAEVLMWMGRQRFADIVWLHGCEIREGRLRRRK